MNRMSEWMLSSSLNRKCISIRRKSLLASNAMRDKVAKKNKTEQKLNKMTISMTHTVLLPTLRIAVTQILIVIVYTLLRPDTSRVFQCLGN